MNDAISKTKSFFERPAVVVIGALLACALWGSATPFIKLAYRVMFDDASPDIPSMLLVAGLRAFFAGLLTVLIYSVTRKRLLLPKPRSLAKIGLVSLFQTVIQSALFFIGLANTSGAKGTVISGSSSFFAILVSALIFRQEKLTVKKIVACIVGFLGIVVINLDGLDLSMNLMGDGLVLLASLSLAVALSLGKIYARDEDPVVMSGYQFIMAGILLTSIALPMGGLLDAFDISAFGILAYLSLLSALAYAIWGVLIKYNPVSKITIFSVMTPVFGVLLTALMLSDEADVNIINLILSLFLVSLGVFMLNYTHNTGQKSKGNEESISAEKQRSD